MLPLTLAELKGEKSSFWLFVRATAVCDDQLSSVWCTGCEIDRCHDCEKVILL